MAGLAEYPAMLYKEEMGFRPGRGCQEGTDILFNGIRFIAAAEAEPLCQA